MYDVVVVVDVDVGVMDSIMEEEKKKKKAACREEGSTSCTVLYETTSSHPTNNKNIMREEDWTAGDDVRTSSLLCVCRRHFPAIISQHCGR